MTPEQWERTKRLFLAALEREPTLRPDFLARECGGDAALRREVESLLESHETDKDFIENPADDIAAALLSERQTCLSAGQMVGRFRVESLVAKGGMGEVYLAEDESLGRKVALKLLPPRFTADEERVRRFEREARAASALNHPNILTVYEVGRADSLHYIATEFVEGKTLREHMADTRMTTDEVLDVAAKVASALHAAHKAGIVHRDIKPENIMLRPDLTLRSEILVKVLDFGLAKLGPQQTPAGQQRQPRAASETNPGVVMGTVGSMSPEQARGLETDARTDVWSLGVVLYEMLAGRAPFEGETPSDVMASILRPEPPLALGAEVPDGLREIVARALSKDKAGRYETAGEMARALKGLRDDLTVEAKLGRRAQPNGSGKESAASGDGFGAAEPYREPAARTGHVIPARMTASARNFVGEINRRRAFAAAAMLALLVGAVGVTYFAVSRNRTGLNPRSKKSIAVLPLKPIDTANRDAIYELGIADSLIHRLSSTRTLLVRPLSATRGYADVAQDPLAAGREQQVDYVLAANYQLAERRIRVTAQLFDVASGQIEETKVINQDAADVFATQDAVAGEVWKLLQTYFATSSDAPAAERGTNNEEAYRLYLQGKNLAMKRNQEDHRKAIEYFNEALRLDPNYAHAYARMAHAFYFSGLGGNASASAEKVKELVKKALELDHNLADAYVVRGEINLVYEWNFPAAEKDFRRAIELEPGNDLAHWLYALLQSDRGRFDEAMAEIETAQAIDPGALVYMRDRGRILLFARRYDDAIVQLKRVLDLEKNFRSTSGFLVHAYVMKGDYAVAYEMLNAEIKRANPNRADVLQEAYETEGWQGFMRKNLEFRKLDEARTGDGAFGVANLCARLGEKEQAFEYLNKAVGRREWVISTLRVYPGFDSLYDDPRFAELVRRVGSE